MSEEEIDPVTALHTIVRMLEQLDPEARRRVLEAIASYFRAEMHDRFVQNDTGRSTSGTEPFSAGRPSFSSQLVPGPKEFLAQKQPHTDVERIACLAYYLTHFRETPFFKTLDLAKLNTEAAYPKFPNAAYAANNAVNTGYLAPASAGQRQISAAGEQFVQALPDRVAAKALMTKARRRRAARRKK